MTPGATRRWGLGALLLLCAATLAWARLGGGEGYSGGGGSGGSGGSGGGGGDSDLEAEIVFQLLRLLVELCWYYPEIGLPLVGVLGVGAAWVHFSEGTNQALHSSQAAVAARRPTVTALFDRLKDLDHGFSRVVLVDFVHALFHAWHRARGTGEFTALGPWLGQKTLEKAAAGDPTVRGKAKPDLVDGIVIGSLTPLACDEAGDEVRVRLLVKANLTETVGGKAQALYLEQELTLARPRAAKSLEPETARTLGCPGCGSPMELTHDGRCVHCDRPVARRPVGWYLRTVQTRIRRPRPDLVVSLGGVETGTLGSSVVAPDLAAGRRALVDRHRDFSFAGFEDRVRRTFLALQHAWSTGDEAGLRPLETDLLFESHRYWLGRYREKGLRNRIEDVTITAVEVVRIELDAFYESITVRIHASMRDFVEDAAGKVVGGDDRTPRRFSEYWTFVRTADAAARGPEKPFRQCPSCGAPLDKVSQAGICGYCDSKVVTGSFGWILALIEQDEEYAG